MQQNAILLILPFHLWIQAGLFHNTDRLIDGIEEKPDVLDQAQYGPLFLCRLFEQLVNILLGQ